MSLGRIRGSHGFDADVDIPAKRDEATTGDLLLTALNAHAGNPVSAALDGIASDLFVLGVAVDAEMGDSDITNAIHNIKCRIEAVSMLSDRLHGESAYESDDVPSKGAA